MLLSPAYLYFSHNIPPSLRPYHEYFITSAVVCLFLLILQFPHGSWSSGSKSFGTRSVSRKPGLSQTTSTKSTMTLASSQPEAGMVNNQLMSFAEFEAYVASNEWVNNDDFDPDSHPDHTWFQVNTAAVSQCLEKCCTMISKALGIVPRGDVELRHLERNVLELRNVVHGPAKKIFCMGSAGRHYQYRTQTTSSLTTYLQNLRHWQILTVQRAFQHPRPR
jgi:hypothetical protein